MSRRKLKIAIAYDFDGTLASGNMQEHSFIPKVGLTNQEFWKQVKTSAKENDMNEILSYMHIMLKRANEKNIKINKKAFEEHGNTINYFEGVEEYFDIINKFAFEKDIQLEHYIISSGLRDILNGTKIKKYFKYIFASAFEYDVNDVACWPALAVDYTSKTQYLFRINKGILNSWDNSEINKYTQDKERYIPFERMIYIGDGETDIPAMKMINHQGGYSIAVYYPNLKLQKGRDSKQLCKDLLKQKRVSFIVPADYTEEKELMNLVKKIIEKIKIDNDITISQKSLIK